MESGVIKTLFTSVEKDEALFPRTKLKAVSADSGVGLDALLDEMNYNISNKAPAGFGLGKHGQKITDDLNNINRNGFYYWDTAHSHTPFDCGYMIHIESYGEGSVQIAFSVAYKNITVVRRRTNFKWGEWEYVNPPMALGVEYRTTKRHNGKPVYVRMVETGALPNASYTTVEDLAVYVDELVDATLVVLSSDGSANWINTESDLSWYISNYGTPYASITTHKDMSASKARITIEYTKTTD